MKPPKKTKSPSVTKPDDNQLNWDYILQRVDNLLKVAAEQELRINRLADRIDNILLPKQDNPFAEPKQPKLNWVEQEPAKIQWEIHVDPTTLILTPGTHMRYDTAHNVVTTYDGVAVGQLQLDKFRWLQEECYAMGAKLHVYLTSSRKLGIKLGRPA